MKTSVVVLCFLFILIGDISGVYYDLTEEWMVRFMFDHDKRCDGSVVANHFVLTLAECFLQEDGQLILDDYEVVMYKAILRQTDVSDIFIHEEYNKKLEGADKYNLALVKFDVHFKHAYPIRLYKSFDDFKGGIAKITEKAIKVNMSRDCQNGYNLCSKTIESSVDEKSIGAGLNNYDPILRVKVIIGVLMDVKAKENVQNYQRINEIADWIEAHTSDDTVTVENYCQKSADTAVPRMLMKPKIQTQGQYFKFDWQVRIFNNITNIQCSGSLIRPGVILTAASCVMDLDGNVNTFFYTIKYNNFPEWLDGQVEHVSLCTQCVDFNKKLMEKDLAMMGVEARARARTIAPITYTSSKGHCDLVKESYAHYAIQPAIRKDFVNGQSAFNAHRFISNRECSALHEILTGRVCTKSRQEFNMSPHDIGSGLIYCNENTGIPQLYAVLVNYDVDSKSQIYAYLDYYQNWVHF